MTRSVRLAISYIFVSGFVLLAFVGNVQAEDGLHAVTIVNEGENQKISLTIQILILMTLFSLLPAALMMMTSFTRIIIVLSILRQAIGLASTPSSQTLLGLALFLTIFIMTPIFSRMNTEAIQPYLNDEITLDQALERGEKPIRTFMLGQTRESDLSLFASISGNNDIKSIDDVPFSIIVPAFVTSELKTAFQIGFLLFIPFLIIDLVVSSVLMSMGMMMLSPMIVSLPFKIMLFVLVDGWNLIIGTLASSFFV